MRWSARREILTLLLDAHERSVSYGRAGPWSRDILLKFDGKTFPDAFAPAGRPRREGLLIAIAELEAEGAVRVERLVRGPARGEVKSLRLGAAELPVAERAAVAQGFEPLAQVLLTLSGKAASLDTEGRPVWLRDWLKESVRLLAVADTSGWLGIGRPRVKRLCGELIDALVATTHLAGGVAETWERVISERIFRDSKRLAAVRLHVVAMLVHADPRWEGVPPEEAQELLEAYGVRRKPGLLRCAGVGAIEVGGRSYRIEDFAPAAHLPDGWAPAWVDGLCLEPLERITTVENEYPFLSYIDERGGPLGLGRERELVVYTAGFPTPSLVAALAGLARRAPQLRFRHWGDADVGGLRIWNFLRGRLGVPVDLFRTTAAWVRAEAPHGGRPLSGPERGALGRLREELASSASERDVPEAMALIDALLETGIKLEQERY